MTTARLKFDFHYGRLLLDRELQFSFSQRTNTQSGRFRIFFLCVGGGGGGSQFSQSTSRGVCLFSVFLGRGQNVLLCFLMDSSDIFFLAYGISQSYKLLQSCCQIPYLCLTITSTGELSMQNSIFDGLSQQTSINQKSRQQTLPGRLLSALRSSFRLLLWNVIQTNQAKRKGRKLNTCENRARSWLNVPNIFS